MSLATWCLLQALNITARLECAEQQFHRECIVAENERRRAAQTEYRLIVRWPSSSTVH